MTCEVCGWDDRDEAVDCCMRCGAEMPEDHPTWLCECGHRNHSRWCEYCGKAPEEG